MTNTFQGGEWEKYNQSLAIISFSLSFSPPYKEFIDSKCTSQYEQRQVFILNSYARSTLFQRQPVMILKESGVAQIAALPQPRPTSTNLSSSEEAIL